jgi:hypothetical protein
MEQKGQRQTTQVPIDAVSPDELPRQTGMKYEEVCQIVGDLYFRLHHQETTQQEQFKAVLGELHSRIQELVKENNMLKVELQRNDIGGESTSSVQNPVGQGEG